MVYESNRYVYRGSNPNNYITFNNETWRIISVENDGTIKIIKDTSIGDKTWDAKNTRNLSADTYCETAAESGCNAWAANSNLVGTPSRYKVYYPDGTNNEETSYYGYVTVDASLNSFLNNDFYNNSLNDEKKYITNHNFYVYSPEDYSANESITTNIAQEKLYTWNGKVGLLDTTDYVKSSLNSACTSVNKAYSDGANCGTSNWLKSAATYWTINPFIFSGRNSAWIVKTDGKLDANIVNNASGVRPTVYLSSEIKLNGSGTSSDKYTIVNN